MTENFPFQPHTISVDFHHYGIWSLPQGLTLCIIYEEPTLSQNVLHCVNHLSSPVISLKKEILSLSKHIKKWKDVKKIAE